MLATGAANGHCDIAAVISHQRLQPMVDELGNVTAHVVDFCVRFQKFRHRQIFASQVAHSGFVVRVGQHAHIKDIVGIKWNTALEGKGLKHQSELCIGRSHQCFDISLQLRGAQHAAVKHQRLLAHFTQQLALQFYGLDQCAMRVAGIVT